jgi:inhibitor of KinA
MKPYSIYFLNEEALCLSIGDEISIRHHSHLMRIKASLESESLPGLLDITIAYNSLTLHFDYFALASTLKGNLLHEFLFEKLALAFDRTDKLKSTHSREISIPVCYDEEFALDWKETEHITGLTFDQIVTLHHAKDYRVYMVGFIPGFPYLGEMNVQLKVPRKKKPRAEVPAGSVGMAGLQTGIYPLISPGGWQIIGKTPIQFFDKNSEPPVPVQAGDTVTFYPISKTEFEKFSR